MKKIIHIFVFFLLMEYQVFFGKDQYSLVTAIGLVLLCAWQLHKEDKIVAFKNDHDVAAKKELTMGEKIAAGVYAAIIILSFFVGKNFEAEFAFVMIAGILSIVIISIRDIKTQKITTWVSSFTIPKITLYLLGYLLSVQIHQNIAYQSILLLSCCILYNIASTREKVVAEAKKGQISHKEFKHFLFHRWSKYWNFFLGIWYLVALRSNGFIGPGYEYLLMFGFMIIYFTFLMKNENIFTIRDFVIIVMGSAVLAGLSPLVTRIFGNEVPAYVLASIILFAFDIGDIYFHQREFNEASIKFWSQKAAVYVLMAIYIVQVHLMMTNTAFSIDQVVASIFH